MMNKIQHIIRDAVTTMPTNETGGMQAIQISHNAYEPAQDVPSYQHYGFVSSPPAGSLVLTNALAGDNSFKQVVGSVNQTFRLRNTPSGGTAIHDEVSKAKDSIIWSQGRNNWHRCNRRILLK